MLLKRGFDIFFSGILLILAAPVLLLAGLAVWIDSGRPIFYSQERIGRRFRPFRILKFRSMRAGSGPSITVRGDSRVTRVGRLLRRSKLDELPQLWNVLRGDMSLVGPRPEVAQYVELQRARYERILEVRPGITDLASLQMVNEEEVLAASKDPLRTYTERILPAKLDLAEEYLAKRSLLLDLRILGRTAGAVVGAATRPWSRK